MERPSRSCRGEGNRLRVGAGGTQDAPGVGKRAHSEGLVGNRRGPTRRPTSGEGGAYKQMVKWHRAGRESEGLVVPTMERYQNLSGGKGPCFGRARDGGKCEGMTARSNNPFEKARELHEGLSADAKHRRAAWYAADPVRARGGDGSPSSWVLHTARRCACTVGRPSVSRLREIRMHGLKGGFRSSGSQEHRA